MQIDLGACSLDSLAFTVLVHSFLRRAWRSPTHTQEAKSLYIGQKSAKRNNSLPDTKVECNWGQTFWTNKKKRGTRGRESSKERKDERCFSIWSKCSTYLCKLKDIQKKDSRQKCAHPKISSSSYLLQDFSTNFVSNCSDKKQICKTCADKRGKIRATQKNFTYFWTLCSDRPRLQRGWHMLGKFSSKRRIQREMDLPGKESNRNMH